MGPPSGAMEVSADGLPQAASPSYRSCRVRTEFVLARRLRQFLGADSAPPFVDESEGRVRATVTAAVELSNEERGLIGERLSRQIGKEVRVTAQVDRGILGGLRLQYGDHLVDASVATRLQQLRRILAGAT